MKTYLIQQKRTICQYQSATISADSSQEAIEIFNQLSDEDKQWQETDHTRDSKPHAWLIRNYQQ